MEYYFVNRYNGWFKLPKNEYLRRVLSSCPLYEDGRLPHSEVFISNVDKKMVGIVDLLLYNYDGTYDMIDWKTSGAITPSLERYGWQMNFYRQILEDKGVKINEMYLMNYNTEWQRYDVDAKQLINVCV